MTEQNPNSQEVTLLEWSAPEFNDLQRGPVWYLVAGLVVAGLIFYGIRIGSMSTVGVFLLLMAVFLITHHKRPQQKHIRITDMGVHYGSQFYPYPHLQNFWVVYHPPYIHCVYFRVSGEKQKLIRIQLNGQSPVAVRKVLAKEVAELEGGGEPFFDMFSRILRLQ